jgi:hypothetical protein
MNAHTTDIQPEEPPKPTGLALMRAPFLPHQISKLPKPTKTQTDIVRNDFKKGIRCQICGGWHHPDVIHLDYVGHAALTDRLLDCDPEWDWAPVAVNEDGTPKFERNGGMWITLTVCGKTRLGYGDAEGKSGGNAIKEVIGDALRNAAMRFGAALDLWHNGDLHLTEEASEDDAEEEARETISAAQFVVLRDMADQAGTPHDRICQSANVDLLEEIPADLFDKIVKKLNATIKAKQAADLDDSIPEFEGAVQ